MYLKLVLIPLLVVLLNKGCTGRRESRHPPLEKEEVLLQRVKPGTNRHYRSVHPGRHSAEEGYKLENVDNDEDNDLKVMQSQNIVGDPETFLQRKRWKRASRKIRALRYQNNEQVRKACFKCKPASVPLI